MCSEQGLRLKSLVEPLLECLLGSAPGFVAHKLASYYNYYLARALK